MIRPGIRQKMQYMDSIKRFFRHPKWGMNLLLQTVCMLIPIVGPIVLQGYHVGGLTRQFQNPDAEYPEFDFNRFTVYLGRGIWPFLVGLVVGFIALSLFIPLFDLSAMAAGQ